MQRIEDENTAVYDRILMAIPRKEEQEKYRIAHKSRAYFYRIIRRSANGSRISGI
jgi:hypothetical protein